MMNQEQKGLKAEDRTQNEQDELSTAELEQVNAGGIIVPQKSATQSFTWGMSAANYSQIKLDRDKNTLIGL